jgi:putative ABC transport system permease protein
MLRNYFKVAVRNLSRNKVYSIINIAGLAIGMTCCVLILLWVQDELSYDRFHQRADNLYRITETWHHQGETKCEALTSPLLAPALKEECPEINLATRFSPGGEQLVKCEDKRFQNDVVAQADNDFFQMFSFPFVMGDPKTALIDPFSVVVSEKMSQKYFGNENPLGRLLNIDRRDFTVTGVMENIPDNSHLQFDCLVPFESRREWLKKVTDKWLVSAYATYVLVDGEVSRNQMEQKISSVLVKHISENTVTLGLQPIKDIHLYSAGMELSGSEPGDIKYVYMFSAMAVLILLIACINFMNLSTARSGSRAKEIGVRKVIGADKKQIRKQFFGESILLSFVALAISLALLEVLLPAVSFWLGKPLSLDLAGRPELVFALVGLALLTGVLAGSYPALLLSSFKPIRVLKAAGSPGSRGATLRKTLVVVQFAASVFLIISALVISGQLGFMTKGDLGFDQEHLLYVRMRGGFLEDYQSIKGQLLQNPDVISVSAGWPPKSTHWASQEVDWEGKDTKKEVVMCRYNVDFGYVNTLGMEVVKGRDFSQEFATDQKEVFLVNEEAVRQMGLEEPIGKQFSYEGRAGKIVGVLRDFHQGSLRDPIYPLVLQIDSEKLYYLLVRLKPGAVPEILSLLESRWQQTASDFPFEYHFLDQTIEGFYRAEQRMGTIFRWSTFLAILISCMGLFGLAAFAAEKRTKEIGIRKVLGASAASIVKLLSKEIILLVLIANLIAAPIAYWAMTRWLENFAYRIDVSASLFFISALVALATAVVTVSYQAIKAALTNPVETLRYE